MSREREPDPPGIVVAMRVGTVGEHHIGTIYTLADLAPLLRIMADYIEDHAHQADDDDDRVGRR